jgi:hypothetical protein
MKFSSNFHFRNLMQKYDFLSTTLGIQNMATNPDVSAHPR